MTAVSPMAISNPYSAAKATSAPIRLPKHLQPAIIEGRAGNIPGCSTTPAATQGSKKPKSVPVPNTCGFRLTVSVSTRLPLIFPRRGYTGTSRKQGVQNQTCHARDARARNGKNQK